MTNEREKRENIHIAKNQLGKEYCTAQCVRIVGTMHVTYASLLLPTNLPIFPLWLGAASEAVARLAITKSCTYQI